MAYNNCFVLEPALKENLERIRERIDAAARRAGRDSGEIKLLCVTKGVPAERIREAAAVGVTEIGENRIQEVQAKGPLLKDLSLRWHLVGHLQRNKAKLAVELFDVIHSVDSIELIELLEEQSRQKRGQPLEVLLQVNVSGESSKHGCRPEEAQRLAESVLRTKHLKWAGLMTMAPYTEEVEGVRPVFRRLRELRDVLQDRLSQPALHLSMGMSGDFEAAVEEGATIVRIGTAIFGER